MPARAKDFADVVRYAPGPCLLLDGGVVLNANAEAVALTGIPLGRLMGVHLSDFVVPEDGPVCEELVAGATTAPATAAVRLAHAFIPIELSVRLIPESLTVAGLRSMAGEHYYSALARAELTHDPLTGFSNRYHLLAQLQERLAAPATPVALVGLWIDELPQLTATRGIRAVERVVKEVGSRIQGRLRSPDLLGRFDEAGFLTLLTSDASPSQLADIGDRLRDEVAFPVELEGSLVSFTASVAVASIANRQPALERIVTELDATAARVTASGGNHTEQLEL